MSANGVPNSCEVQLGKGQQNKILKTSRVHCTYYTCLVYERCHAIVGFGSNQHEYICNGTQSVLFESLHTQKIKDS